MASARRTRDARPAAPDGEPTAPAPSEPLAAAAPRPPVELRVRWDDFCCVEADVHAVGHYQGVMPTSAEKALDVAISGTDATRRIIAEHTRRQWFVGDFGHVNYFPPATSGPVRIAAVAGMGRPGTFTESRSAQLAENLLLELCALGSARHIAVVPIGAGAGNLTLEQAARSMAKGFTAALTSSRMRHPCTTIDVVELDRLRAERLLAAFRSALNRPGPLALAPELVPGTGGGIAFTSAAVLAVSAVVRASRAQSAALADVLAPVTADQLRQQLFDALAQGDPDALVGGAELSLRTSAVGEQPPVRISVIEAPNGGLRVAAITGTATVPERQIDADPRLIDEIVRRMNPPAGTLVQLKHLSELMSRLVVPGDLQSLVTPLFPIVFEVDRRTARIHWELVADLMYEASADGDHDSYRPLVLQQSISRQLRTTYSRPPALKLRGSRELNVLVIGDPGGVGAELPGARQEALAVHEMLHGLAGAGVQVTTLIGAKGATEEPGFPPAERLDVLDELLSGVYEVVHYCGHGTFDAHDDRRAGWYFADGLLTSRELNQLSGTAPRLVVANACHSSRITGATGPADPGADRDGAANGDAGRPHREAAAAVDATNAMLTPSLADEFFRCGVSNYIGAAWPVADDDAVRFSKELYLRLLGPSADTIGEAVTAARRAVWDGHDGLGDRGTTWMAYQHYGDPSDRVRQHEEPAG